MKKQILLRISTPDVTGVRILNKDIAYVRILNKDIAYVRILNKVNWMNNRKIVNKFGRFKHFLRITIKCEKSRLQNI